MDHPTQSDPEPANAPDQQPVAPARRDAGPHGAPRGGFVRRRLRGAARIPGAALRAVATPRTPEYYFPDDTPSVTAPAAHGSHAAEEPPVDPQVSQSRAAGPDQAPQAAVYLHSPVAAGFLLTAGVGLALLLYWVLQSNSQLLVWILAALFIALGLDPLVRRFERWGAPRPVGVLAAVLGLAAVIAAFLSLLVPTVVEQGSQFVTSVPETIQTILGSAWFRDLDNAFHVREAIEAQVGRVGSDGATWTQLFGGLLGIGGFVANAAFSFLIILVLTLYFLSSLPLMKYWAYRLAPRSRRQRVEHLAEEIISSVGNYVMGQSVVAAANGTVAFIALLIAGGPYPALLAFVAALLAFIPLIGALTAGILITAVCLTVSWQTATIFAAIYFIYLQVEAYVVSPRVMARAVAVPAAVAVIAVIAGGTLLGVLGALMAIPTAAAVMLLVREVLVPRQDAR
ncbi:MAG: AI-2E family transporter [Micrococcus sp.]|nr:AI-2E family transporter [Micrococcus sp.]